MRWPRNRRSEVEAKSIAAIHQVINIEGLERPIRHRQCQRYVDTGKGPGSIYERLHRAVRIRFCRRCTLGQEREEEGVIEERPDA